jgi:hypothetical protein
MGKTSEKKYFLGMPKTAKNSIFLRISGKNK